MRARRFHDLRRTGVTVYRQAGADKDTLRLCTHGAPGQDVIELYTSFGWETLCCQIALCALLLTRSVRVKKWVEAAGIEPGHFDDLGYGSRLHRAEVGNLPREMCGSRALSRVAKVPISLNAGAPVGTADHIGRQR